MYTAGQTRCTHLGVSFHAVEPNELDVETSQWQAVLGLAYPGLLVERFMLVCALYYNCTIARVKQARQRRGSEEAAAFKKVARLSAGRWRLCSGANLGLEVATLSVGACLRQHESANFCVRITSTTQPGKIGAALLSSIENPRIPAAAPSRP